MTMVQTVLAGFVAFASLVGAAGETTPGHDSRDVRHKIADAYGVHAFDRIERIDFTFNVTSGDRRVRRSWAWWPQVGRVRYVGGTWRTEPFEYDREDVRTDTPGEMTDVDQRFINDSYWLVFPFHVEWDVAAVVTDEGQADLAVGDGVARRVVVAYPPVGGYTPGDVYELYVGHDYRIREWVFRPGGSEEKRYAYTWDDERRFGDVTFATDHANEDGSVRVWLSEIVVEFEQN